jgi:Ankyrin repeats (3 copies)
MRTLPTVFTFLASLVLFQPPAVADSIGDIVSRIQTNLNRVAAGLPPIDAEYPVNADRLVEAFSALVVGDAVETSRALRVLDEIEIQASASLRQFESAYLWQRQGLYARFSAVDAGLRNEPGTRGRGAPWIRFVAVAYKAITAIEIASRVHRSGSIRIPCPLSERLDSLTFESRELATRLGSPTDCPEQRMERRLLVLTDTRALPDYLDAARRRFRNGPTPDIAVFKATDGTPDWARRHMGDRPEEAAAILRSSHDLRSRIDYALFLYYFEPPSVSRDESIRRAIFAAVELALRDATDSYRKRFDYSFVRRNIDQVVDIIFELPITHGYRIPCTIVIRAPQVTVHTEPRYGGSGDAFLPQSDCDSSYPEMFGYPLDEVPRYRRLATAAGKYGSQGTIWTSIWVEHDALEYRVQADPRYFLTDAGLGARPYEMWSYLSIANRSAWREIDAAYEAALAGLLPFYRRLGLSDVEAESAANNGLHAIVLGADCGDSLPPPSFRKLLLDGASMAELRAFGESGAWRNPEAIAPLLSCANFAGIDPLAHIAVLDTEKFSYLRTVADGLPPSERSALDLDMDVNARNAFGKTPLMTAIQHGMPEAVSWLMANGADVSAVTDSTSLEWGRRTALMYAAASGSLAMIEDLIRAGVDPHQADTMGRRALHYLLGVGPTGEPPNPALSDEDMRIAYSLLR